MIQTQIYNPTPQPNDCQHGALPDFQPSLPQSFQKTNVNSGLENSFQIEESSIFLGQQLEVPEDCSQNDCREKLLSSQSVSEDPIAMIDENLTNIYPAVNVPANVECLTSKNLPNKDASDNKSTTDENQSANREFSPLSLTMAHSNESQNNIDFVGKVVKSS
jgi:hypothetical protein